ncbi:MAG: hypothetical protein IH984_03660 [Planctomycetes bacterium]|nr:hypothetical protein [Planctomycetota bacterium]
MRKKDPHRFFNPKLILLLLIGFMAFLYVTWRGYHEFIPRNYPDPNPIAFLSKYDHGEVWSPSNDRVVHVYISSTASAPYGAWRLWLTEYTLLGGKTVVWQGWVDNPSPPSIRWLDDNRLELYAFKPQDLSLGRSEREEKRIVVEFP